MQSREQRASWSRNQQGVSKAMQYERYIGNGTCTLRTATLQIKVTCDEDRSDEPTLIEVWSQPAAAWYYSEQGTQDPRKVAEYSMGETLFEGIEHAKLNYAVTEALNPATDQWERINAEEIRVWIVGLDGRPKQVTATVEGPVEFDTRAPLAYSIACSIDSTCARWSEDVDGWVDIQDSEGYEEE